MSVYRGFQNGRAAIFEFATARPPLSVPARRWRGKVCERGGVHFTEPSADAEWCEKQCAVSELRFSVEELLQLTKKGKSHLGPGI